MECVTMKLSTLGRGENGEAVAVVMFVGRSKQQWLLSL